MANAYPLRLRLVAWSAPVLWFVIGALGSGDAGRTAPLALLFAALLLLGSSFVTSAGGSVKDGLVLFLGVTAFALAEGFARSAPFGGEREIALHAGELALALYSVAVITMLPARRESPWLALSTSSVAVWGLLAGVALVLLAFLEMRAALGAGDLLLGLSRTAIAPVLIVASLLRASPLLGARPLGAAGVAAGLGSFALAL